MRLVWAALVPGSFFANAAYPSLGQAVFKNPVVSKTPNSSQWSFIEEPSIGSTSQLIFSTVSSLLQHWPNTRYRNGHNIVPATVPIGTLLYHGTVKNELPKGPDWTATDPEHSYLFCRSIETDSGCWHLTLVTTRPLKLLYFDGSSAANMQGGPIDSQDLVIWGEVKPDWTMREMERITDLCDWGKNYQIDGFVRMEMDFEIMLCDFSAGVKPVSFLNIASVDTDPSKKHPLRVSAWFRAVEAGSWHNNFPGDPRIHLDYTRLISFYDLVMFPSLQAARLGQGRMQHRLDKISLADAKVFSARLAEVLTGGSENSGSGVDWQSVIKVITNRNAERLEILHYILNSTYTTSEPDAIATLKQAHRHITSMIVPYILHSSVPPEPDGPSTNYSWAVPVFELCATTHTSYLETDELLGEMTPSERLLLQSVKGVTKEICRVLVGLWAEGMESGYSDPNIEAPDLRIAASTLESVDLWKSKVEGLMAWLDWSYWLKCRPACGYEKMCYLPTWPFFARPEGSLSPNSLSLHNYTQTSRKAGGQLQGDSNDGEWIDPQPRCIRRVEPIEFKDSFPGFAQS